MSLAQDVADCIAGAGSRQEFWVRFLRLKGVAHAAEIGVMRGVFAEAVLAGAEGIEQYTMLDPWRHLEDWNKPANRDDDAFEACYRETLARTEFAAGKRRVLRGKTTEVAHEIADQSLDWAYIDGDHTLRGITIDLAAIYPKVRDGGWIGGDDFCPSIWQHDRRFEPTLVFPYAVFFAEAMGATIFALPFDQFLLHKTPGGRFQWIDLTGRYGDTGLRASLAD